MTSAPPSAASSARGQQWWRRPVWVVLAAMSLVVAGGAIVLLNRDTGVASTTVAVSGTGQWTYSPVSENVQDFNRVIVEHFVCTTAISDPRISGQDTMDITTTYEPAYSTTARWEAQNVTRTNSGGTWRGNWRGNLTMDNAGVPYNYGEATYTGEGDYAGLTYHELMTGGNTSSTKAGWIEPSE